jgi:hypothetical protein
MFSSKLKHVQDLPVVKFGGRNRTALGDITNSIPEDLKESQPNKKTLFSNQGTLLGVNPHEASRMYMQRACDDIDERDSENPLLVTEYVNEMYEHFSEVEKEFMVSHTYMSRQEFVNEKMRAILVDWLVR